MTSPEIIETVVAPEVKDYLSNPVEWISNMDMLSRMLFGRKCSEAIREGICLKCGKPAIFTGEQANTFEANYKQTGLCQTCEE